MKLALLLGSAVLAGALVPGSSSAAPAQVRVPLAYNQDCIAPMGVLLVDGDCDGGGYAFMDGATVPKAGPLTLKGVSFTFPEHGTGDLNSVVAVGQTVNLAGKVGHAYLHLLSFSTDGANAPSAGSIKYSDGTVTKVKINAPDWTVTTGAVLDMAVQGPFQPANALSGRNHAYVVSVPLNPKKKVVSVTLPKTPKPSLQSFGSNPANYQVLAMTLSATPVTKSGGPVFN